MEKDHGIILIGIIFGENIGHIVARLEPNTGRQPIILLSEPLAVACHHSPNLRIEMIKNSPKITLEKMLGEASENLSKNLIELLKFPDSELFLEDLREYQKNSHHSFFHCKTWRIENKKNWCQKKQFRLVNRHNCRHH